MSVIPYNRIKVLRETSKLTQKELAKLLDIDHTTVNKHENHLRPISKELVESYSAVFKVSSVELFHTVDSDGNIAV